MFDDSYRCSMDFQHLLRMIKAKSEGKHISAPPAVVMEGTGVSSNKSLVFKESFMALHETGLLRENKKDFLIYAMIFVMAQGLYLFKLKSLLKVLKKFKYPMPLPRSIDSDSFSGESFVIVTNSYKRDISLVERSLEHSLRQNPAPGKSNFY